jgi:hypothetical protein
MDLFVLLINQGVGVYCLGLSEGFSLLYDTVLHKCSLVCSSYQSGRGCLLYTGLAFLLQARDFLFCTKRSCTNVPWFVLLINQGVGVYSIQVSPSSYKRGIFSSVRHGPAQMFPSLFLQGRINRRCIGGFMNTRIL